MCLFLLAFSLINDGCEHCKINVNGDLKWQALSSCRPTLKHQRPQDDKQKQYSSLNEWFIKGTKTVSYQTECKSFQISA